jgi:hypothetical protein
LTVSLMMFSPSVSFFFWRFPVQLAAHEPVNCTDCALHER